MIFGSCYEFVYFYEIIFIYSDLVDEVEVDVLRLGLAAELDLLIDLPHLRSYKLIIDIKLTLLSTFNGYIIQINLINRSNI